MEWYWAGAILMGCVMLGMALGFPVAMTFLITNIIGTCVFVIRDYSSVGAFLREADMKLPQIMDSAPQVITSFTLVPIPMFVLMGALFFHTGLAVGVFDALDKLLGNLRGRLCYLTVLGGALFSTLTGSTMANTAMLGSLMVPEMQRRGYSLHMSMGPVLGTGGLAMIIPPSSLGVLLASIAGLDVGKLLIAGLLPGFLLAGLYAVMIWVQLAIDPDAAPPYVVQRSSLWEKIRQIVVHILPMGLVVFMVIGFIVLGWATPSESACFGVAGVIFLALVKGKLSWDAMSKSLVATIRTVGMVFFILMNSIVFSQLLSLSGASKGFVGWVTSFQIAPLLVVLAMFGVLILLGMFMDQVSMMMITAPIFFPIAIALGYDPIWFALIVLMSLEMSATTPPFGLLLFIMMGLVLGTTLWQVALAAAPYLLCDLVLVGLLIVFPIIGLWLPSMMR
jgi:tripartite ATP-independent transporter DctM subunit